MRNFENKQSASHVPAQGHTTKPPDCPHWAALLPNGPMPGGSRGSAGPRADEDPEGVEIGVPAAEVVDVVASIR